jgi:hypothetical protein
MHDVDALAGGSVGSSRRKRVDLDLVAAEEDGRRVIRRRGRVALIYITCTLAASIPRCVGRADIGLRAHLGCQVFCLPCYTLSQW